MVSWLVARWRILVPIAAAVVIALVAAIALVAPVLSPSNESATEDFDCTQPEEMTFQDAGPKAQACGVEVEVVGERTPWETHWAMPDGNARLEVSSVASRTDVTGKWTDVDTSIEGTPGKGTLEVAAPVYPMELNAGGTAGQGAPLGSIERDGKRIDVWFPTELPVPEVEGPQVRYALAAGVRLIVTVNADGAGFTPVVELADPAAAARFRSLVESARPEGFPGGPGDLVFSTEMSDGLRLVPEEQGSVLVMDDADEVHFLARPPVMWDSAGEGIELKDAVTEVGRGNRLAGPLAGDAIRMMDVSVDGTRIVISPDQGMLASRETVWPVYIDPAISGKRSAENVAIRTGGYTGTLYNWSTVGGEGAGYCSYATTTTCNTTFTQRLVWEYSGLSTLTALVGTDIVSAGFRVYGTHSYSCSSTTTDLHMLAGISASTTWNSLEWASYNRVSSRTEYHSVSCGNTGWRIFDAKWAAQQFADNDSWTTLSLGLKARDESTMTSWKRFGHDATLEVVYNRAPNKPASMRTLDANGSDRGCVIGAGAPYVNTLTPKLTAVVSDPDGENVSPHFQVYTKSGTTETEVWNSTTLPAKASGSTVEATVADGKLVENQQYFWRATSTDGTLWSGWGASCELRVDVTAPKTPTVEPVTSSTLAAVYESGFERGGVGLGGEFRLTPHGDDSDVVKYEYSFTRASPSVPTTKSTTGGTLIVPVLPQDADREVLTVRGIDRAGNKSVIAATYTFDVAAPVEDAVWSFDEVSPPDANGKKHVANSGPLNVGDLVFGGGVASVDGPHRLFGSRDDDYALRFDGSGGAAVGDTVLDTTGSFTVSAHVRLNATGPGVFTALSQDGVTQSAFELGFRSECAGAGSESCWSFSMPNTANDPAVTSAHVPSGQLPDLGGQWVHLVGEHNAAANTVRMWVCPVGTPAQPGIGAPVASESVQRPAGSAWQGPGGFAVGRGQSSGAGARWWPGEVDNVRVFSGEVVDAGKLRRLCQGAEAESYGSGADGFDLIDPTVLTVEEN